ncbi:MAG TPA: NAD(P)H-binding protein [Streptosporangiaceae bacterium]|jgi:uncharacterized protein YbjT (DUF2867 family)
MIVITGATGQIGSKVVEELSAGAEPVRVIVRDPARLPERIRDRVEVVQGSLEDPDVLAKAYAGADAVFWLSPPNAGAASIDGYMLGLARTTCAAIAAQGVGHVVGVSSLGRGSALAAHAGQITAALAVDDLIAATGAHYRALCMPGFMENTLTQVAPIRGQGMVVGLVPGDLKLPSCATRDIAAVAAGLLRDRTWTGRGDVAVLGPEDLSNDDMARVMSEVLGRPVRYQRAEPEAYAAMLTGHGMTAAWAQGLVDMSDAVSRGLYADAVRTPDSGTHTTFRQWCEEVLKPAVEAN